MIIRGTWKDADLPGLLFFINYAPKHVETRRLRTHCFFEITDGMKKRGGQNVANYFTKLERARTLMHWNMTLLWIYDIYTRSYFLYIVRLVWDMRLFGTKCEQNEVNFIWRNSCSMQLYYSHIVASTNPHGRCKVLFTESSRPLLVPSVLQFHIFSSNAHRLSGNNFRPSRITRI